MTEEEWLKSVDARRMVDAVKGWSGATARRKRLFAVACVRRAWHLIDDVRVRELVEAAEAYADGLRTPEDVEPIRRNCNRAWEEAFFRFQQAHPDVARFRASYATPEAARAQAICAALASVIAPEHCMSAQSLALW